MFPTTNSSQTIIDCFLQEAERLGIEIRTHHAVTAIEPRQEGYMVLLQNGLALAANTVVLACGGYNQLLQYSWLQNLALTIEPPVPSLFTFNAKEHRLKSLMGVSASQAIVQLVGTKYQQQGPVLITHWGLSGPAAIKLSAWVALELAAVHYQYTVRVNWLGETLEAATDKAKWMKQHQPKQKLTKNIFEQIPQRLWDWVLQETKIDTQQNWADINTKQWQQACQLFTQFTMPCEGKTTYKEEFVTAGGIALQEIDVATMQLKKWPGIFVAGEVMNTDGVTGGFNFQNAWTTAFIAAKAIASTSVDD
ncbi:MAG: aminoacetone oxidase family FAD-binding enzyme [Bacteroidetes bacterium]|nr:MAG: aminoacetone oxidase family FAD-binding enzyme [Bacteroidota bacterium]